MSKSLNKSPTEQVVIYGIALVILIILGYWIYTNTSAGTLKLAEEEAINIVQIENDINLSKLGGPTLVAKNTYVWYALTPSQDTLKVTVVADPCLMGIRNEVYFSGMEGAVEYLREKFPSK